MAALCGMLVAMAKRWTDAEFEVVSGPRRMRYRRPRLNRLQYFLALCVLVVVLRAAVYLGGGWVQHLRTY